MSEQTQSSITYDERAPYMINWQTCVDIEFGGYDHVSKSALDSLHYRTYPAHGAGYIHYPSPGDTVPGSDKGLLEGSTPSPQFRSWDENQVWIGRRICVLHGRQAQGGPGIPYQIQWYCSLLTRVQHYYPKWVNNGLHGEQTPLKNIKHKQDYFPHILTTSQVV